MCMSTTVKLIFLFVIFDVRLCQLMQNCTSIVEVKCRTKEKRRFRLVQNHTSIVGYAESVRIRLCFRPVQICTSVVGAVT